jgi:hypothetical protein
MADRERDADKSEPIVRLELGKIARTGNGRPIKFRKKTELRQAYRAKIEAMLAELACEQLVDAWRQVCPFAIAAEFGLPDRLGIIRDLADFAEVLQSNLEEMTSEQLCRQVAKYGRAANRKTMGPSRRPKALRVKLPTLPSSQLRSLGPPRAT